MDATRPTPPDQPGQTPQDQPAQTPAPDQPSTTTAPPSTPPADQPPASAPADAVAAAQPPDDPRDAQIAALEERLQQLEANRAMPGTALGFGAAVQPTQVNVPKPPENLPDYAADWPQKGGLDGPQPWDLRAFGIAVGVDTETGAVTFSSPHTGEVVTLAPGAPDTISPIVIAHGRPMLTSGSSDPRVNELGQLLGLLGYSNSVSEGKNPQAIVDETVMGAVDGFRRDYGVEEDPSQFPRDGKNNAQSHVGPWTWEAILRAGKRLTDQVEADGRQLTFAR